jgi:putative peptidoglycan lipid II flippase
VPASFGLILASDEIVNALFGYGSFLINDVKMTALALQFFGYGVPAFALIKVLSNFFFARDNTKTPFYISALIVILNILISVSLFHKIGFIIIPIATSISAWIGVLIYLYSLNRNNSLLFNNELLKNFIKLLFSTIIMSITLVFVLDTFSSYLEYTYKYKAVYLILIVGFVGMLYLLSCYLLGILKLKKYKTN